MAFKKVTKDKCWACNLKPGHSTMLQIAMLSQEERNQICDDCLKLAYSDNPYLKIVKADYPRKGSC